MNIIIPMAGMGKRMRPHTLTTPKPLIPIAGKPMVHRIVEDIVNTTDQKVEEIAFVISKLFGEEAEKNLITVAEKFGAKGKIFYQEIPLGTADAILCAKECLHGNTFIAFADTLFKANFSIDANKDAIIWTQKVADPSAFGVVKMNEQGIITEFVEKPTTFVSDLAIIGVYYFKDGEKTIQIEENFPGNVMKYGLNFNTNQVFLKNKLNVNLSVNVNYTDNSDFNAKNNLKDAKDYFANFGGSSNISYNNLLNKNININGWFGLFSQNYGNSYGNQMNFFHNISVTKIFPKTQMEASLQMYNIFKSPVFDVTTYAPIGTFRNSMQADWYGFSLTFIKRFGNQKVKENTKTNVEKDSGGSKN